MDRIEKIASLVAGNSEVQEAIHQLEEMKAHLIQMQKNIEDINSVVQFDTSIVRVINGNLGETWHKLRSLVDSLEKRSIETPTAPSIPVIEVEKPVQRGDFDAVLKDFVADINARLDAYMNDKFPNNPREVIVAEYGRRFVKLVRKSVGVSTTGSAYGFIDRVTGDMLKAASWAAPAKHARGNIFDRSTWKNAGPYGMNYLR